VAWWTWPATFHLKVRLVAPPPALITRNTTSGVVAAVLQAGNDILHGSAGWFKRAQYPNIESNELPIAKEAGRTSGPGAHAAALPELLVANLVRHMWLVMGIIIAVLLPLSHRAAALCLQEVRFTHLRLV
jgi:hypothetical protein